MMVAPTFCSWSSKLLVSIVHTKPHGDGHLRTLHRAFKPLGADNLEAWNSSVGNMSDERAGDHTHQITASAKMFES